MGDFLCMEQQAESIVLFERKSQPWLSLKNIGNAMCRFTFHNENIPKEYLKAGVSSSGMSVTIQCNNDHEAELCMQEFADFIYQGYGTGFSWLVALDIGDIEEFFSSKEIVKFIQCETVKSNLEEALQNITQYLDKLSACTGLLYMKGAIDSNSADTIYELLRGHISDFLWCEMSLKERDTDKIMIDLWIGSDSEKI